MSDDAQSENESAENPDEPETSQPTDTQPEAETDPASADEPAWAEGKSREDLLKQTQALMDTVGNPGQSQQDISQHPQVQQQNTAPNPNAPQNQAPAQGWQQQPRNPQGQFQSPQQGQNLSPQQQQAAAQQGPLNAPPSPDDFYNDEEGYQRAMNQWAQQLVQAGINEATSRLQPMMQNQAAQSKMLAKQDPDVADVFERYEPEIVALVEQQTQPQARTVDTWKTAAEVVAGRHRNELAEAKAEEMAAQMNPSPTNRQGGGQGTPTGGRNYRDAIDELWESDHPYVEYCEEQGMTAEDLREQAAKMGHDPETFVEIFDQGEWVKTKTGITTSGF